MGASRILLKKILTKSNQIQHLRKLTVIYNAVKFFKPWIEGYAELEIRMDHKPLTYAFLQKSDKAFPRQLHQLSLISQFTTKITYIQGQANTVANSLFRINT